MTVPRRTFIVGGLGGALLLAAGSALALRKAADAAVGTGASSPTGPLTPRERATLEAVAEALDPGEEGAPGARALGTARRVEAVLATLHPRDLREVRQALRLLDGPLAGLLAGAGLASLRERDPPGRRALLLCWRDGRIGVLRRAFLALDGLCAAATWSHPAADGWCGYPGPPDHGNGRNVPAGRWSTLADLAPPGAP